MNSVACDHATLYAWQSTWYGPYALTTPLRDYSIPRALGRCQVAESYSSGVFADCSSCVGYAVVPRPNWNQQRDWSYAPSAGVAFGSARLERLGQIPNDLGGGPEPPGAPTSR